MSTFFCSICGKEIVGKGNLAFTLGYDSNHFPECHDLIQLPPNHNPTFCTKCGLPLDRTIKIVLEGPYPRENDSVLCKRCNVLSGDPARTK